MGVALGSIVGSRVGAIVGATVGAVVEAGITSGAASVGTVLEVEATCVAGTTGASVRFWSISPTRTTSTTRNAIRLFMMPFS
jgi:hypothetical protein